MLVVGDVARSGPRSTPRHPGRRARTRSGSTPRTRNEAALAAALTQPPFHVLAVSTRAELERESRRDPLAHGTLIALGAAALLALVLAAVGLALAVWSDLRDDRGELYELEAQGGTPSLLRRVVRSRALALAVAGLVAGALTGFLLVTLVTRLVSVTARAGFADPPLEATVDPLVVVVGVVAYALLAVVLVGAATRNAFARAARPEHGAVLAMAPIVDARDLYAVYPSPAGGVAALHGLTLSVDEHEICVVLGPSGSGKTTLMRVLAGFERPSAGSVLVARARARPGLAEAARATPPGRSRLRRPALLEGARGRAHCGGARRRAARALCRSTTGTTSSRARAPRARRPPRPSDGAPGRALRRRAAAHRALRRPCTPPAPPHRRRADGRARCRHRGGGPPPAPRARRRARIGGRRREPRPGIDGDRRPRRPHPGRPRKRGAHGRDRDGRRRHRRLAARAGGDAACRGHRRPRASSVDRRRRRAARGLGGRRRAATTAARARRRARSGARRGRTVASLRDRDGARAARRAVRAGRADRRHGAVRLGKVDAARAARRPRRPG